MWHSRPRLWHRSRGQSDTAEGGCATRQSLEAARVFWFRAFRVFRSSLRLGSHPCHPCNPWFIVPPCRDGELNHDDTTSTTRGGEEETQPIPGHPGLASCPVPASCASRLRGSIPLPAAGRKRSWPRMTMGGHALRRKGKKMAKKRRTEVGAGSSIEVEEQAVCGRWELGTHAICGIHSRAPHRRGRRMEEQTPPCSSWWAMFEARRRGHTHLGRPGGVRSSRGGSTASGC